MINVGEHAPDFVMKDQHDNDERLSDFQGRKVLLAFYVADWSPVCGPEMTCFKDDMGELKGLGINAIRHGLSSLGLIFLYSAIFPVRCRAATDCCVRKASASALICLLTKLER